MARLRKGFNGLLIGAAILGFVGLLAIFVTGDFGAAQYILNGIEARALANQSTISDRLVLKALYQVMIISGKWRYPRAGEFLAYYCSGQGDTLHFDAKPLLRHPEMQLALRHHKQAITFRHQPQRNPQHHVVRHTDWDLYYAFDLLFIRQKYGRVSLYDQYYFQPLARKSHTPFHFGKIHFKLNDGLIHVAYPAAKMFTTYGEAALGTP
ncbi:hypothetical protein [Hymenobacter guriensis]|uniref:Uncharacterized protein n=1 Tax=Hymenobacter guriensis TaxID=2793065 RepID=A0ABS0L170_9BACT|nr:hypothetical protein [Hymenobacter guriensis]MBG8553849.1 hypothetical protein [Hymenobacter guriensis]